MKKSTLLFFYLLPLAVAAQVKIIDNPDYRFKNTGLETISRIELHDTITKVHIHVTFLPGWWIEFYPTDFIKPVESDKRYYLLGIENQEMHTHLSTPSGVADYVLLFPPLEKSVKEIHYGDMKNNQEVISIFNISLEKSFDSTRYQKFRKIPAPIAKRLKNEVKAKRKIKPVDFDSDTFFNPAPSRLVGFIKGYSGDTIQTYPIQYRALNGQTQIFPLKLYPEGYFEADINIEHPKILSFSLLKSGKVSFYIEPGHTLSMILDWEDILDGDRYRNRQYIFTKTEFDGTLANVNRDLLKQTIYKPNWSDIDSRMKKMGPVELQKDLENRINDNLKALQETDGKSPLCPKAKRLIENEIKMSALSELLLSSMYYLQRENEGNEVPLSTDYYSPLKMVTNDRSLLSVVSADQMLSSLNNAGIFFRPGNIYRPEFKPEQTFEEYLLEKGVVLSEETIRLLPLIQATLETSNEKIDKELLQEIKENSKAIEQVLRIHINEFMAYHQKYTKLDPIGDYKINLQKREAILTDSLGINGILKDLFLYREYNAWLKAFPNLPSEDINSMTETVKDKLTDPFLKEAISNPLSTASGRVAKVIRIHNLKGNDTIGSARETESKQVPQASPKESKEYLKDATPLNNYSFDLYHKVKNEKENILLSPLSTYYALLLAYEGAEKQTKQEFEKVLHLKGVPEKTMDSLLLPLTDNQQGYQISNAVWRDNDIILKEQYGKAVTGKYSSEIKQTDFKNKETAASDINNWISEKTDGKIQETINSSQMKDSTSIVIANTVYLNREWQNKFNKETTKPGIFFASVENQYKIDLMRITETLPYYENDLFQCISKPYQDSHLSFCVILPKALFGIAEVEKEIDADFLNEILDNLQPANTMISLPKLELGANWELRNALKEMGLTTAFSDQSDYSALSDKPLSLENIIHHTVIGVDEEKTEAAAATHSTFWVRGLPRTPSYYHVLKADHPFLFFVVDNRSKAIVFMGRYSRPTDTEAIEKKYLPFNIATREKEEFFITNPSNPQNVLLVVDKKVYPGNLQQIKPNDVETFQITQDKKIIRKYTSKEYDHAILITLKKKKKREK